MMRRSIIAFALAGAVVGGWALPAAAQQNGLVIENNGIDNSNSAAGADNVQISRNPGSSQSANGGGAGNQELRAIREPKEKKGKDKSGRNVDEGAAPEAAPAEGDLEAYAGDTGYVPEPEYIAPEGVTDSSEAPVKLPNTGLGVGISFPFAALAAGLAAAAFGVAGVRRRQAQ